MTRAAMASSLSAASLRAAERHLVKNCAIMAHLVATHGHCGLTDRETPPFVTLVSSIIGQQLSTKAAATIRGRVEAIVPNLALSGFAKVSPDALRGAGLSAAKVRSLLDLAQRVNEGRLDLAGLASISDEGAIAELTTVMGIGRWTAEMFLIFGLKRPNVLALSDAGLRRAARLLYGDDTTLEDIGIRWHPYRSVASWYLWRHLDAVPS